MLTSFSLASESAPPIANDERSANVISPPVNAHSIAAEFALLPSIALSVRNVRRSIAPARGTPLDMNPRRPSSWIVAYAGARVTSIIGDRTRRDRQPKTRPACPDLGQITLRWWCQSDATLRVSRRDKCPSVLRRLQLTPVERAFSAPRAVAEQGGDRAGPVSYTHL